MKNKIICLAFILTLLLSSTAVYVNAQEQKIDDIREIGKVHIDASAILKQLGYTEKNMSNAPRQLLTQIIRSYPTIPTRSDNGDYYVTITNNSAYTDATNIIGSNTTVPYTLSDMPNVNTVTTLLPQKACLIIAIWDYPGTIADAPTEPCYNVIYNAVSNSGCYDYWHSLTNAAATNENIWNWITWACSMYEDVDIYFRGHGTQVSVSGFPTSGFVCYDAWDDTWGLLPWNLYYPSDLLSGQYDYSTLRVGAFGFCYGYGFNYPFLSPGGSTSHDRAMMGPVGQSLTSYSHYFFNTYCDSWYNYGYSSYESYLDAYAAASGEGGSPYSYDDTGIGIWA